MAEIMKGLAVGRIVHFTTRDYTGKEVGGDYPLVCKAAIVTRVVDGEKGIINLCWFDDTSRHVQRNIGSGDNAENTWHTPERVE